jgi:hypothetical protein
VIRALALVCVLLAGCRLGSCVDGGATNREGCVKITTGKRGGAFLCAREDGGYDLCNDGAFGRADGCIPAPAGYVEAL